MEKLHHAVENKDAAQIAQLFQHKRIPTKGMDEPLLESSDVATKCLDRFVRKVQLSILQALLLSPTAYEAPWKATHSAIQVLSSCKDENDEDLDSIVMLIQTFIQQVATEWKIAEAPKIAESKDRIAVTGKTPRHWIERLTDSVLQSTSPKVFRILPTLCSLSQSKEEDFHRSVVRRIACYPNVEGNILVDWLRLLRSHADTFDLDTWIVVIQTFDITIRNAPKSSYSSTSCMQCLLSLYQAACGIKTSVPNYVEGDILWHQLAVQIYELSYLSSQQSLSEFHACHKTLQSSLTGLSSNVLLKWVRWTFQGQIRDQMVCIGMALAIFQAWSMSSRRQSTKINMAPILCEELGKFLFSDPLKDDYKWTGEKACVLLMRILPQECQYQGRGIFCDAGEADNNLLNGVANVLFQTSSRILDPCTARFLVDGVFESTGDYFEVFKARDLLLCTLLLVIIYETHPSMRTHLLTMLRQRIDDLKEGEGAIRVYCLVLRLIAGTNPSDDSIWKLFLPCTTRVKSSDTSMELKKALIRNRNYQSVLCNQLKKWITKPLPTDCGMNSVENDHTLGYLREGFSNMAMLVAYGSPDVKQDILSFIASLLKGEPIVIPSKFYKKFCNSILKMITSNPLETWVIEFLLRHFSRALRRKLGQYNNVSAFSETDEQSLMYLQELICTSKVFTGLLRNARVYGSSELIDYCMPTYSDLLDAIFAAFIESQSNVTVQANSFKNVADFRTLDVRDMDFDIGCGFSALSSLYETILGGTKVLSIEGVPQFDDFTADVNASPSSLTSIRFGSDRVTKENLMYQGKRHIAYLCLDERVWKDKPVSVFTPFVLAIASLFQQPYHMGDSDAWMLMPHHCIFAAAFADGSSGNIDARQIDCILALILHLCDQLQSNNSSRLVNSFSLQDFRAFYMAVCCEEKISDLLIHLESCNVSRTAEIWQVLDPTGRQNLEASLRKFRGSILEFIASSFETAAATSTVMNHLEYHELESFALVLCREFSVALKCDSGGVDANLCVAFLSCIESAVCLLAAKQGHFDADGTSSAISFCQDVLRSMDSITAVLNLTISEIVESILSLTMIALPAYADAVLRECYSSEKAESAKVLAAFSVHRHTLFEKCLQRNLCQTKPLEESPTRNTSLLVVQEERDNIKSLDSPFGDPVGKNFNIRISKLLESDRTSEWLFTAVLRAYRDALYYATQKMQAESFIIQSEESRLRLARLMFQDWDVTLQNILSLLETGRGEKKGKNAQSGAINLPTSVKDWLCAVLEQFSVTLNVSIMCLNDLFSDGSAQLFNAGNLEAFCLLLSWFRLPEDPLQCVRPWLASEERIAARANAKQSVVVTVADGSCTKDLARVVDHLDELTTQLDQLRHSFAELPPRSLLDNRITLRGHMEALVDALCDDSLEWDDCLKTRWQALLGTSNAKVKTEKSSTLPAKRKKRKYTATSSPVARNRNQVVLDWLQKDKGTGDGKVPDDTFADLEDFLVED